MSSKPIRTALFGGTFDPIHNGHLMLANYMAASGIVDSVMVMVSPQNPFKTEQRITDDAIRLEMARIALAGLDRVEVSDFEFSLPRPSYTFDTLAALSERFPDREFIPVVGTDNWNAIDDWHRGREIISRYGLIVYPRPGHPEDPAVLSDDPGLASAVIRLHDAPVAEISSTYIRSRLANGDDLRGFIPESVAAFIKKHKVYTR